MTPRDWKEIEKLLEPVADQETLLKVKTLLEGMGNVAAQESVNAILNKLNSGVTAGFRTPIRIAYGSKNSSNGSDILSGTGKGIIKVCNGTSGSRMNITIDGVKVVSDSQIMSGADEFILLEFTKSFDIQTTYGSVRATAVFY